MLQKWCQKAYLVFYWPAELHCCSKSVLPVMHQRSTWGTKLMLVLPVSEQTGILQIYPVPRNALCCTTFRQVRFVLVVWLTNLLKVWVSGFPLSCFWSTFLNIQTWPQSSSSKLLTNSQKLACMQHPWFFLSIRSTLLVVAKFLMNAICVLKDSCWRLIGSKSNINDH